MAAHSGRCWGRSLPGSEPIGESWEVCDVPGEPSGLAGAASPGMTLRQAIEADPQGLLGDGATADSRFPFLVKYLDARQLLSVQVHPDDTYAAAHENGSPGKTEMWLVLHAEPGRGDHRWPQPWRDQSRLRERGAGWHDREDAP